MKINKQKLINNSIKAIFVILIIFGIAHFSKSLGIYVASGNSSANLDLAFSLLDVNELEENIKLADIKPDSENKDFTFEVRNYLDDDIIDVNMEYRVNIIATTNLPLTFALTDIDGNSIPVISSYEEDSDGTIFYVIKTNTYNMGYSTKETNKFKLSYSLGSEYNQDKYQDIIELVSIKLDVKQV